MNRIKRVRKVTDGALMVGLIAVMELASNLFGGLYGSMIMYLIPIPILIYSLMHDFKYSLLTTVSAFLISFIIIGPFDVLLFVIPSLIVGLICRILIQKNIHYGLIIFIISMIYLIFDVLATYVFGFLFDYNIFDDVAIIAKELTALFEGYLPFDEEILSALLVGIMPSIMFLNAILGSIIFYLLSYFVSRKLKLTFSEKATMSKLPDLSFMSAIFLVVMPLFLFAISDITTENSFLFVLYSICINIFFVLAIFYIMRGLLVASRISREKKMPLLYVFAAISVFIFPYIVIIIGLIFDIKKVIKGQ